MVIAIDGPAGAGKTSTARAVAQNLGYHYMDTGAMYRAITYAVLTSFKSYAEDDVSQLITSLNIDIRYIDKIMRVFINGDDVTRHLRSAEINQHVSVIASYKDVREKLVEIQRDFAAVLKKEGIGVVVDGRDIGTVVFPKAAVKIFLSASPEVRAQRRFAELAGSGKEIHYDDILNAVNERDAIDSTRDIAPLRQADDALLIDTSTLSFEDQVLRVIKTIKERQMEHDV